MSRMYTLNPKIVFRPEEEGAFLFNPKTGELKFLNKIGSSIWKLLTEKKDLSAITTKLSQEYPDIDKRKIRKDLLAFLAELKKRGCLA